MPLWGFCVFAWHGVEMEWCTIRSHPWHQLLPNLTVDEAGKVGWRFPKDIRYMDSKHQLLPKICIWDGESPLWNYELRCMGREKHGVSSLVDSFCRVTHILYMETKMSCFQLPSSSINILHIFQVSQPARIIPIRFSEGPAVMVVRRVCRSRTVLRIPESML